MKVIHIITALNIGGAEKSLFNILHGGLPKEFDICVVSLCNIGAMGLKIQNIGVPVIALNMNNGTLSFYRLMRLIKIVRDFQPDVIQGWMYHGNFAAIFSSIFAYSKAKLVWNVRHSLSDISLEKRTTRLMIRLNKLLSHRAHVILYNSFLSRTQHENFGFSKITGIVIPNGIDLRKFFFSDERCKTTRLELGIPGNAKVVGHVARLHPMKDQHLFFKVAINLAKKYPDLHFIICGRGIPNSGVITLVPRELSSRFHILDENDEIPNLMSAMNIFCLSSAWGEGFPNVLGEAMSSEVPCVSTDVGDSRLIIGDTGYVSKAGDENAFFANVEVLLEKPLEELHSLGGRARKRIELNYSLGEVTKRYARLYNSLDNVG